MKALIRKKKEVVTEDTTLKIDWLTGMPLTNDDWEGGPYTLVEDYTPHNEDRDENLTSDASAKRIAEIANLKARLAALENDL